MSDFEFLCSCCGEVHREIPDLSFDAPLPYHQLTDEERAQARLGSDVCQIGEDRFVRGVISLPVHGLDRDFGYGVWVSLSPANFARYLETFEEPHPSQEAPWFGWLSNSLPGYPVTFLLKTSVHLRPYPTRPFIELEPSDHPLAVEQRTGISQERLRQILELNLHPRDAA